MSWNHRVVRKVHKWTGKSGEKYEEVTYGIHEAFYDDNGKVFAITQEPVEVAGDDIDSLKQTLEWMEKCLEHPILEYENIPEEGAKNYTNEIDLDGDDIEECENPFSL